MSDALRAHAAGGRLRVVAGILEDGQGRVLLAQRPPGKAHAGLWEFPGGKVESGETDQQALRREWQEELGLAIEPGDLVRRVDWPHVAGRLELSAFRVAAQGTAPIAQDGQSLAWVAPCDLLHLPMPPADRPIAVALRLPTSYAISPDPAGPADAFLHGLERTLAGGIRMVSLRAVGNDGGDLESLARRVLEIARRHGAIALLHHDPARAARLGFDGVHLNGRQLRELESRPLPAEFLVGASCHGPADLARLAALDVDFATWSPVLDSSTHPSPDRLGWIKLGELARACPIPAYALGGMTPDLLPDALAAGAHGIAGISGLWRADPLEAGRIERER